MGNFHGLVYRNVNVCTCARNLYIICLVMGRKSGLGSMVIIQNIQGWYTRAIYCQPVETVETCVRSHILPETSANPEVAAPFKRFSTSYDFQWGLCDYVPFWCFQKGTQNISKSLETQNEQWKKGPELLFRVGDHTSQLCGDYFRNHCKDLYQASSTSESKRFFFWFVRSNRLPLVEKICFPWCLKGLPPSQK